MSTDNTRTNGRRWTLSSTCLVPMLGQRFDWYNETFVNAYYGDRYRPEHDNNIFVLLDTRKNYPQYNIMTRFLTQSLLYIEDYEVDETKRMFVFRVPEIFQKDYEKFKKGQYSKLSPTLKRLILGNERSGANYDVLMKSKERRQYLEEDLDVTIDEEAELLDPPNPETEIYGYEAAN